MLVDTSSSFQVHNELGGLRFVPNNEPHDGRPSSSNEVREGRLISRQRSMSTIEKQAIVKASHCISTITPDAGTKRSS